MLRKQYEEVVNQLESFFTPEGTPSLDWNNKDKAKMLWDEYEALMSKREQLAIALFDSVFRMVEGKPIYVWQINLEIVKLKLALLLQLDLDLDKEAYMNEIKKIEALLERNIDEETA